MNLRQMEIFEAVMRTGTVTAAARELGLTQPAVSKLLRHSEDQLGIRLFFRHKGRLLPTTEAREIYPAIETLFQNVDTVQKNINDLSQTRTGILRLATVPTLGAELLPAAISAFLVGREQVKIGVKVLNAQQTVDRVVNQQVEFGIAYAPAEHPALEVQEVCRAEAVCVVPRGHVLAELEVVRPEDLVDYPLISVSRASLVGQLIDDAFKDCGIDRRTIIETSYALVAYGLVEAGAGIAVVDPFVMHAVNFRNLVVKPFRPLVRINPQVVRLRHQPLSPLSATFIAHLRRTAETSIAVSDLPEHIRNAAE